MNNSNTPYSALTSDNIRAVSPALASYTQKSIGEDLWKRPDLSPRDRSLITVAALVARIHEQAEAQRSATVEQNFGAVAPGVVQYTTDLLFRDLWLRPALAPRDRSLITVSALIASGQVAQITYHLNRAMDNGLTRQQASEMLTQLAFYTGWPPVFSALPVVKEIFEKRPQSATAKG